MKIIHIITTIDRGGAENQLIQMIEEQCKRYDQIYLIFLKGNGFWKKWLKEKRVHCYGPIFPLGNYLSIKGYFQLSKLLNNLDDFLIHMHMPPALLVGCIYKIFNSKNCKYIYTSHNDEPLIPNKFADKLFSHNLLKMPNKIIAISNSVSKYLIKRYSINKSSIKIIPYGFSNSSYIPITKEIMSQELNYIKENTIYLGTVARLVEQKRIDLLIESFALLKKKSKLPLKLVIIGDGILSEKLKRYSIYKKVEKYIIWINKTNYVLEHMNNWDLFCLTSEYEGFGLVLLEAISSGLPIVAMQTSSIKNIIGPCGIVVEHGKIEDFASSILNVLKDPGKFINKEYIKNFSIEKNTNLHFQIYFN